MKIDQLICNNFNCISTDRYKFYGNTESLLRFS